MKRNPVKSLFSPERLRWSIAAGASAVVALLCAAPAAPAASTEVIVRFASPTTVDTGSALVEAAGGQVTRRLDIIDAVGAELDAREVASLRRDPRVRSVTPNASVAPKSPPAPPPATPDTPTTAATTTTDTVAAAADAAATSTPAPDWSFLKTAFNQSIGATTAWTG